MKICSRGPREIGELREKQIAFRVLNGTQTEAAYQAQEAEAHLADVDRLWNEYLRVDLARRLLQRAIEEFREQNQSSILARANDFFQRLTVSRYHELIVEYNGTTPYLEAIHIDGSKRRVHQMSDGARDQLFLSLRLAFVEQRIATFDPLPLIMDDILLHFDDDRTQARLQCFTNCPVGHRFCTSRITCRWPMRHTVWGMTLECTIWWCQRNFTLDCNKVSHASDV
ncbi:hypothetical protein AYJ22_15765 [Ferroacidibacillus organovorans]|uniref:DNA replication and repair protein RecF n=1 Tax=Ferroacidibacillus organovorans TaxID=1765683 RepID=A0A162UNI9_9BACL|nr:hypothetical protein AYJ22_15765 [Ferroacidibacillus organovorans]OPG15585.1 hypothetical protein B2M26_10980 [Ferroacidibacillus organovorans]